MAFSSAIRGHMTNELGRKSARIRFAGPTGDNGPGPTFSPALFYVGNGPERFEKSFDGIGVVWVVPGKIVKKMRE